MTKISSSLYYMRSVSAGSPAGPESETRWTPSTDVYLTEDGLVIKVELAGIRREDLEITVEGSRIVIGGHRPDCCRGPTCRFLMMEINYGHFETVIDLPPGYDPARAKASYQNGFLRVDVPQTAGEAPGETDPASPDK
jgi:HSP20 family protein